MTRWRNAALPVLGLMAAAAVAAAPAATGAPGPQSAVTGFGSCMAAQGSGDLLLMIDESASLQVADPAAARVSAANHLLDQLAEYSKNSGVTLNVAIAGFSENYVVHSGWTELSAATLGSMEGTVEGFRGRQSGRDTDYKLALDGAIQTLADSGAGTAGETGCQAIAWLTDGNLDFTARDGHKPYAPDVAMNSDGGVQQLIGAATESICRPGGVADQLRSSGIVTFAIGLANSTASPEDFNLMRAIATAEAPGGTECGAITSPSPGAFFLAENIDELLFAFDAFSTPGQAPIEQTGGVCQGQVCPEGEHRFVLDNSIGAVNVLATADADGLVPTFVTPSGQQVALDNRTAADGVQVQAGGVDLEYQWKSDRSVTVSLANAAAPDWQGVWALAFVDPTGVSAAATSRSSIHISGNLFPALRGADGTTFHSGDQTTLQLGMVGLDHQPIDPEVLLGQATMSATLIEPDGAERPVVGLIDKDQLATPVPFDLSGVNPGRGKLRLTLNVTTAEAALPGGSVEPGTVLEAQVIDVPMLIAPPIGYPELPGKIDFGTVEGAGAFTTSPTIEGSGCVWLDTSRPVRIAASPDGIGDVVVRSASATSQGSCVAVVDGASAKLPLTIDIQNAANGKVNGTVSLSIMPANGAGDIMSVDVDFTAHAEKPIDSGKFWLALVLTLILGPGIPLLLLYLSKWLTAKIPGQPLKIQRFAVSVANNVVLRDGVPFALADRDLIEVVRGLENAARSVSADGVELSTHIGRSPFGAGFVTAHVPGMIGASGQLPATDPKTRDARLPLAVHNSWFVAHDPAGPEDRATLVLLVGATAGPEQVRRLVEEACQKLPEAVRRLRADTAAGDGSGSAGPGGGPGGGGPDGGNPFAPTGGEFAPTGGNPFAPPPQGFPNPAGPTGGNPFAPPPVGHNPFQPPSN